MWDFGDGNTAVGNAIVTHTFGSAGPFTVTLTAINLAASDVETHTVTVAALPTATPTGTAAATATPTPTPAPTCAYPPNVIGQMPGTAAANLINAGFTVLSSADLTTGTKNRIQAQNPDHTSCKTLGTLITVHYRPN
jgi:hypothetical protein